MEIQKGTQYQVRTKFSRNGSPAVFTNPPVWSLYNSLDIELLNGVANLDSGNWVATFTIPTNYIVPAGKEGMVLQFTGYDNSNRSYTADKEITLTDKGETYLPNGVFYNYLTDDNIQDSIQVADDSITSVEIKVFDPWGGQIGTTITQADLDYNNLTSTGYVYNITIPKLAITTNNYLDPLNIVYKITTPSGTSVETHPMYVLDFKTISIVNALSTMLDKSKLIEIDPSLQWYDVEYIQAVLEGVKYVNASPPEGTFWKLSNFPTTLDTYLLYAAAVFALQSRLLAEGLNAFEFQGLNTSLSYNRTAALQDMIDRLKSFLDTLPAAKKSAILTNGKGVPGPGEIDNRVKNIGVLGLSINPLNNRKGYGLNSRRFY